MADDFRLGVGDAEDYGWVTYVGNGSTTTFSVPFDYFGKTDISAGDTSPYINVFLDDTSTTYTFTNSSTISLTSAPANGVNVKIVRNTSLDSKLVAWSGGSSLNSTTLERMNNQFFFLLQEQQARLDVLAQQFTDAITDLGVGLREVRFQVTTGDGNSYSLGEGGLSKQQLIVYRDDNGAINNKIYPLVEFNITTIAGIDYLSFVNPPANLTYIIVRIANSVYVASEIADSTVSTNKLQNGAVTFAKTNFNATGTNNQSLMKRSGTWTASTIIPSDISGFDASVRASRLDQMAAPTANVSMNSLAITNLATGAAASTNACNVSQMESYVTAAIAALNMGNKRLTVGTVTPVVSSVNTTMTTVTTNFDWDWIFLIGNPTSSTTGSVVRSGSGGTYYDHSVILVVRSGTTFPSTYTTNSNSYNIAIDTVANGFKIRKTYANSTAGMSDNWIYVAGKNFET